MLFQPFIDIFVYLTHWGNNLTLLSILFCYLAGQNKSSMST